MVDLHQFGWSVRSGWRAVTIAVFALSLAACETGTEVASTDPLHPIASGGSGENAPIASAESGEAANSDGGEVFALLLGGVATAGLIAVGASGDAGQQALAAAAASADDETGAAILGAIQTGTAPAAAANDANNAANSYRSAYPGGSSSAGSGSLNADPSMPHRQASSGPEEVPENEASNCLQLMNDPDGRVRLQNTCPFPVEAQWCIEGNDCNPGYTNMASISPGASKTMQGGSGHLIHYAACKNRNSFVRTHELSPMKRHACGRGYG